MSDLYRLSDTQMAKLEPFFPKSHGKPRVDDRRVLSGIIFINRNGLRWRDAPAEYGPHKTLYSRWKRWSEKGIFAGMLLELADQGGRADTLMIDATHVKTHRTASSLGLKKEGRPPDRTHQGRDELETARGNRRGWPPTADVSDGRPPERLHRRAGIAGRPSSRRPHAGGPWI